MDGSTFGLATVASDVDRSASARRLPGDAHSTFRAGCPRTTAIALDAVSRRLLGPDIVIFHRCVSWPPTDRSWPPTARSRWPRSVIGDPPSRGVAHGPVDGPLAGCPESSRRCTWVSGSRRGCRRSLERRISGRLQRCQRHADMSGFCQGVAGDSGLSFGGSVRCGHDPYAEPLGSDGALANGRRRRAPTAVWVRDHARRDDRRHRRDNGRYGVRSEAGDRRLTAVPPLP